MNNLTVSGWKVVVAALFFGAVLLVCWLSPSPSAAPEAGVKMELPGRVGGMVGEELQGMSEMEKRILPADTEMVRRIYGNARGEKLACTIVLAGGAKNSIHRPEVCLPAQGWTIEHEEPLPVTLANGRELSVMKVSIRRVDRQSNSQPVTLRAYYLYWFVGRSVTTPSHWTRVLMGSWDRVFHNVNHRWAYVSVFMPVLGNNGDEATLTVMKDFISKSAPEYMLSEMPAAH